MKRTMATFVIAVFFGCVTEIQAGPFFSADVGLSADGLTDTPFSQTGDSSANIPLVKFTGGSGGQAEGEATALKLFTHVLSAYADAYDDGGRGTAAASATAKWIDALILGGINGTTRRGVPYTTFVYSISATLTQDAPAPDYSQATTHASLTVTSANVPNPDGYVPLDLAPNVSDSEKFDDVVSIDVPLSSTGIGGIDIFGPFTATLVAQATAANFGSATVDASDTVSLVSVLLPDGHTPESEGYTVSFESGLGSPNAATPEPSTLVLIGIGVFSLVAYRRVRVRE